MIIGRITAALLLLTGVALVPRGAEAAHYHLTKAVTLGAPDRWDYVVFDPPSHRVYVAHGDRVSVVDGETGAVLGEITGFPGGTHGIAIAGGRGFSDDGKAGIAASFDLVSLKRLKTMPAEPDADGMTVDPASGHVFVVNGDSGKITVIDPGAETAIATIDVGGGLEYAVADGSGKLFVNGAERGEIVRIDTASNRVDARWPMPACVKAHGLTIDRTTHRLFSTCVNRVSVVLDSETGRQIAQLPIGAGSDAAVFDPARKLFFSSNGADGTISVIRETAPDRFIPAETIKTAVTGRTMAIDPKTGRLFVAAGDADLAHPGANGRMKPLPGTLKLLFIDPQP